VENGKVMHAILTFPRPAFREADLKVPIVKQMARFKHVPTWPLAGYE
jgi:uncharacterized protein (UPF0548 family)